MKITRALATDSAALTQLMRMSKAHWGYDEDQIRKWESELTVSESYIDEHHVYKLVKDNEIIAYYAFFELPEQGVKLDSLFVSPIYIGKGLGQLLLGDFSKKIKQLDATYITLDADPNAEGFYAHNGFKVKERIPTSIAGRTMPIMTKTL